MDISKENDEFDEAQSSGDKNQASFEKEYLRKTKPRANPKPKTDEMNISEREDEFDEAQASGVENQALSPDFINNADI